MAEALNHPTWRMGNKITIDSATLMNKGLEVIEAHWLFDLPAEHLGRHSSAKRHPFDGRDDRRLGDRRDGEPDMAIPVAFALAFPDRLPLDHLKPLSLVECGNLTFEEPDLARFPCLRLAYDALRAGGTMAACLNAANEELVAAFLGGRARFTEIPRHIETIMTRHKNCSARTLEDVRGRRMGARAGAGADRTCVCREPLTCTPRAPTTQVRR